MLNLNKVLQNQQKYGVADMGLTTDNIDMIEYLEYSIKCREYLLKRTSEMSTDYYNKSVQEKRDIDASIITDFVTITDYSVKGYVQFGVRNVAKLVEDLIIDLTEYGVLTALLRDESVGEIQLNDLNAIFYEAQENGKGVFKRYVDKNGVPYGFANDEEMLTILNKLAGSYAETRITPSNALVNSRTPQGYRIAVTDKSVCPPSLPPYDNSTYTAVIRKVKKSKLTFKTLVGYKSLSVDMVRFLKIIAGSENKIFCVGSTGSGKTVNLDIMAKEVRCRTLIIQNPTEIDNRIRDEAGNIINNTVLWEAKDTVAGTTDSYPLMKNLNSHSLRFTPELIIVGEARRPEEFAELLREMSTGHLVWSSFHADTEAEAIKRFASEVATASNMDISRAMDQVCDALDFIIIQKKLRDGTRKIMSITEVKGYDVTTNKPLMNTIFRFVPSGVTIFEEDGIGIKEICGVHKQCGVISDEMRAELFLAGVPRVKLETYLKLDENKEESYEWTDDI